MPFMPQRPHTIEKAVPKTARSTIRPAGAVNRNRRGLSTRQAILHTAGSLLEARGFEALSVDAVARAAGVTRSSVYHQFHSRDGFASVLDRFLHEAERGFRGDPELLRMFYLLVFDRSWSRPELKRLLREAYRFRTRRLAAGLADDGLRAPRADLEALAIVIAAAFDGLYARSLIDLRGARLKRAFRMLGDLARGAKKRRNTKISGQR